MFIEAAKSILLVVSALFPIVDPIGGAPVFLSLTLNYDRDTRRLLARRIAINTKGKRHRRSARCVLPAHAALDGWSGLDLSCDHSRGK